MKSSSLLPDRGRHATRKVSAEPDYAQLKKDLDALSRMAMDLGAANSAVLAADDIVFTANPDETNAALYQSFHWPVAYPIDSLRKALEAYEWAVFFVMDHPAGMQDPGHGPVESMEARCVLEALFKLVARLESEAFYQAHHLAMGLATGNCRAVFCHDEKRCAAMLRGRACRHPYKARPSIRGSGLDPDAIAKRLGWKEKYILAGLVMVA